MTEVSIQELVRKDLIYREQLGRQRYGTSLYAYNGRSAILDAYEEALDLCCYLRQVIEELTIDPQTVNPPPLEPHHRAARERDTDETVAEQYR
jgi:predicted transcriptional regulator